MLKKYIHYLIVCFSFLYLGTNAQCTFTTTVSDVTLQCAGGTVNRSGIAYNPNQYLYYSVDAGNSGYPIETFANTGGTALSSTVQGQDYRGYWWNSVTGKPEGNLLSSGGIYSNALDASFYATSTTSLMGLSLMPTGQQCGQGDIANNQIVYYSSGLIYKYSRTTGLLNSAVLITGLPASIANLNSTSLIFTGIAGKEVGLYDYVNNIVYFINYTTGAYVSSCNLPATAPAASSYQMGYGNNRIFLFNTTTNAWIGYPIVNPACAGEALNFDGINDYITISNLSPWNMGANFTYETWIKPNSLGNQLIAYAGYGCITCPDWVLSIGPDLTCFGQGTAGRVVFFGMGVAVQSDVSPDIGAWTHVAVTYNSSVLKMYINGVLQTSSVTLYGGSLSGTSYMNLGADPGCGIRYKYDGSLDEMRIWNKALCQSEIVAGMNCEIATTAPGLTLNYHFNQGTAHGSNPGITSLTDVSGSGSNGSLANFALNGYSSNWVAGSIMRSGNSCGVIANPNISVTGNSQQVHGGNPNPIPANNTDFGIVNTGSGVTHTFVILNTGNAALNISGVTITGPDASNYSITAAPAAVVAISGSTSLVITFSPSSIGLLSATVNIASNDCDENPYSFAIEGSGTIPAAALSFDGIDDNVDANGLLNPLSSNYSLECWFKINSSTNRPTLFKHTAATGTGRSHLFISNTLNTLSSRTGGITLNGTTTITPGQWYHAAYTYNGSVRKIYLNGVLEASDIVALEPTTGSDWKFGENAGNNFLDGSMDEVRVWTSERSQCDIQSYMKCEIPTTASNLISNFHFNQGNAGIANTTVTTLLDATGTNTPNLMNFGLTGTVSNWVAPGGIITGSTVASPPTATISLSGNGNPILNNATSTSTLNFTDFGSANSRTFVIQNSGTGTLNVGAPYINGLNAAEFSIIVNPSPTLSALASTSFVVAFTPTTGGARTATINITNNDCSKPNFNFAIQGAAPLGEALSLSGSIDLVAGPVLSTNTTNVTLQAKVYWRGTNGQGQMIAYNGNSSSSGYGIYNTIGSGALSVLYGGISFTPFNYTLTPNQWTSLTLVIKNGIAESYVNGLLTNVANVAAPATPSGSFNIGGNILNAENFNGVIDEVLFWNKALTQCEIQTYLNCEIPGAASNLVGNYHFNQGAAGLSNLTVTALTDASGNSNNLNLVNVALTGTVSNWIAPGAVVSGFTTTSAPTGTIALTGNANPILNNATSTSTLNFTDFGISTTRTFVIQNTGAGTLNIGVPYLTGLNAGTFSFSTLPSPTLTALASTSFAVVFTPTTGGTYTATININNNDCAKPIFNFVIQGIPPPGAALDFDGSSDLINISHNALLNITNSLTIESWIKTTSSSEMYITTKYDDSWYLALNGAGGAPGKISFYLNNVAPLGWLYGATSVNDGNWHHVVGTYDGLALKVYVDGKLDGQAVKSSSLTILTGTNPLQIGARSNGLLFQGSLDEFRIWNVARSQCDIQSYMNCEIPTTAAGLVLNYHFNQGAAALDNSTVTTLSDAANALNGTLSTFALNGNSSNWIVPGGVLSGSATPAPPSATINVTGNSNPILNNATGTSTLNFTNFVTASSRTFVIQNTGAGTMNVGAPYLSGINASTFSISSLPASTLAALASTSFVVAFTPTSSGVFSATVNINNNDCSNPIFNFAIQATPIPGAALNFNGINDRVTTIDINPSTLPVMTFEAWVYRTATNPGVQTLIGNDDGGYDRALNITGDTIHVWAGRDINTKFVSVLNTWEHYMVSWSATEVKCIKNGTQIFSTSGQSASSSALQGGIGSLVAAWTFPFTGLIDEVRIWNTTRTPCQVQTYMNCEIPGSSPGLIVNYHFNQGAAALDNTTVTAVTDASGSSNTGTITNMSLTTGTVSNWVTPGAVVSGNTVITVPSATLGITGAGNPIAAGSTIASLTNLTSFGTTYSRAFILQNTGTGTLSVNSLISLSGANASEFTVTAVPSVSLGAAATSSLVIAFNPTSVGTKSAIVNINSSDCANPNYSFVITATAVVGSAINCDGVDDYMGTTVFNTLTSNVTLQARFLWNGIVTTNKVIAYNGNSNLNGYGLYIAANTNSLFAIYGGINVYNTGYTVSPGVWTAAAMVIEPGKLSVYVNGILTNTFLAAAPAIPTNSFSIGTGTVIAAETFNGSIDEVQLWSRALTQCEIASYMNCEVSGTPSGLIANYHFNQGIASGANSTASLVTDVSGNNNSLSLYNFSLTGTSSNWITPGAVVSGSSCPAFVAPEIDVQSNGISIVDGDTTPSTLDNTDFANVSATAGVSKTFTILNTGSSPLTVSSITLGGLNANQFTLSALSPASPVGIGSSATFTLTFAPTSIGTKTAIVTISNNDCDEGIYDFVVSGSSTVGAAFSFDGTNDYVNVGPILTASYTKECWVKIQTSTNGNNFLSSGAGVNGSALWAPGIYNYSLSAGHDGNWAVVQDNTPLLLGTWYHVAVSYDAPSQVMSLYKNGLLVSTNTVAPFTGNNPLSIGAFTGTYTTNGSMDEVRIWNRALCPSEILNNLNCEIATTAPGLIANYHFNQGIGYGANSTSSLVTDFSGSSNTGTLINTALSGTVSNWQSQGAVVSGSACSSIFVPEINLTGNGITINDGDMTPSAADNTDYGAVCVNGTIVRSYTIQNTGTANLTVSGISFTGINAALFTASALSPASPIAAGSQAVFSVSFAPLTSGVKNATLTITNNDCNENPYDVALTGTCNPLPVVTTTASNPVICVGFSTSVNGIGADTYTWTNPVINGQAFTPSLSASYTVVGTNTLTGCTSTNLAVQSITVNQSPTLTASASTLTICNGKTSTLTASGANTFTWNPGIITGSSTVVNPGTNTTYSVSGTSTAGCLSSNTIALTVSVNALPTVTANSSNSFVCDGFTTSLIGSGANTYTWTGGVLNNTAFVPPSSGGTYSLSGTFTLTGCTSTNAASQSIVVNPIPTLSVASDSVICYGDSYSISVSGAATYTWLPGILSGSLVVVSPTTTTSYSVVGTSTAACTSTNSAIQTISVNPLPSLSITPSSSLICSGSSVTLSGSGANTYTWSNGIVDATAFSSTITSTYSLSGTSLAGCTSFNSAFITVSVNPLPQVTASSSKSVICLGDQSSLIGAGALTYAWSGGVTNTVVFSPTVTTTYTVIGTDANTCTNSALASITVNNLPDLAISSTNNSSCEGETNTITVSGASTYTWSGGQNAVSIYINPIVTTSYTVSAIDTNGCFNSIVYTQLVSLCDITIYSGITANNDGVNDVMRIEKIEQFANNKVTIFNRWGKQVAEITGYNNKDRAWPLAEDVDKLSASTYFYIIDLGNGGKPFKGWVELIKN